jgi:hypothetical protein
MDRIFRAFPLVFYYFREVLSVNIALSAMFGGAGVLLSFSNNPEWTPAGFAATFLGFFVGCGFTVGATGGIGWHHLRKKQYYYIEVKR